MDFEEFETLEKFHIMTKRIEEIQHESNSSFTGDKKPSEKKSGGFSLKNTGEYERR